MVERLRIKISQLFVVLLVILISISRSGWEDNLDSLTTAMFVLGVVLVGIASIGRLWCSLYISGYKTHHLVTQGPYSMCRNPLYFFSLLGGIGVGLVSETFLIPLLILIAFVGYYPIVIKREETELKERHKDKFETYVKEVPRFFPKISLLKEPEEYTVRPMIYKRHMFDALWFIWFMGVLEIIEQFQDLEVLPVLFKIY